MITTWAATTGDWDDPKFSQGWNGPAISPAKGDLTLSTVVPIIKEALNISPGVATFEFVQSYEWDQLTAAWDDVIGDWSSGPVPHVAIGDADAPAKADLTLSTSAPKSGIKYNFPVTLGELTATGSIPKVGEALYITPAVANFEFIQSYEWDQLNTAWKDTSYSWETGPSPSVAVGSGISPAKADLTLSGSAGPALKYYYNFIVGNDSLLLTGKIPVDNFGKEFDIGVGGLEIVQTYTWDSYGGTWVAAGTTWAFVPFIPDAIEAGKNEPAAATLTINAQTPVFTKQQLWYIPTADLTLSTTVPDAPSGPAFEIGKSDLYFIDAYDWNDYGGTWATATTNWDDVAYAPDAVVTSQNQPAAATLTLTGQQPATVEDQREFPAKADLTLTGQVPVATENEAISPAKGDLAFASSGIPRTIFYYKLTPEKGDFTTTTSIPDAVEDSIGHVPKGDLLVTGFSPVMGQTHFRTIPVVQITGLGTTSWADTTGDWASSSDTWGTGTIAPTCGVTYIFPMESADGFELTTSDPGWPLVGQPKYIPDIVLS